MVSNEWCSFGEDDEEQLVEAGGRSRDRCLAACNDDLTSQTAAAAVYNERNEHHQPVVNGRVCGGSIS